MLPNKTVGLDVCLSFLLAKFHPVDETLLFVSGRWNDVVKIMPPTVSYPRFLVDVDKPIRSVKSFGDIYNNYVIYAEDEVSLKLILTKLRTSPVIWDVSNSPRGRYVVVTSTPKSLERLFEMLWSFDIMNVVLVVDGVETQNPKLYTSNPFGAGGKCGRKAQLDPVQQCDAKTKVDFSKSLRNLSKCSAKLITPFKLKRNIKSEGSFALLVDLLEMVGKVTKADTSMGVSLSKMSALYNRSNDIVLAPEMSRASVVYNDYDLSDFIIRDQPIWIVPKSPLISNLKIITTVFAQTVWLAILVTLALSVGAWWAIAKFDRKQSEPNNLSNSFLRIWGFLFGMADEFLTTFRALRMLAMFYMVYSILVTCCFQGRLVSVLTQPGREPPIDTIEKLAEFNFWVLLNRAFSSVSSGLTNDQATFSRLYRRVFHLNDLNFTEMVMLVAYNGTYTTPFGWIALNWFPKEKTMVDVIEHGTGTLPVDITFSMRKGHYIMQTLNEILGRIIEGGIPGKLFSDAAGLSYAAVVDTGQTVLTLDHLGGVFIWWTVGLSAAFLVFVAETLIFWYKH